MNATNNDIFVIWVAMYLLYLCVLISSTFKPRSDAGSFFTPKCPEPGGRNINNAFRTFTAFSLHVPDMYSTDAMKRHEQRKLSEYEKK